MLEESVILNIETCYICGKSDNLVRPCENKLCKARTHSDCIHAQYSTNKKCEYCQ